MIQQHSSSDDIKKLSREAQVIIGRLLSAAKNLKLYPTSHPISKRIISTAFTKLHDVLEELDYFELSLAGNVLLINDKPAHITNKQTVDAFLTAMGKRKLGKISFIKGVDMDEFNAIVEVLGIAHEDIENQGGIKQILSSRNVQHVTISGISFGDAQEKQETGLKWKDLLALIAGSDDFIHNVEKNPEEFADTITKSLKSEEGGTGWGGKIKEAVGNIAEKLFSKYEKTDIETYTETISRLILVLTPEMQSEFLFSKPEVPFWDDIVNKVVDNITTTELGDLIAKETKKAHETLIIGGPEGKQQDGSGEFQIPDASGSIGIAGGATGVGDTIFGGIGTGTGGAGTGTGGSGTGTGVHRSPGTQLTGTDGEESLLRILR
ncbi:MAG: hypothetical protein E3J78_06200, partial [Candidatus Cloacimonadota bacterium]